MRVLNGDLQGDQYNAQVSLLYNSNSCGITTSKQRIHITRSNSTGLKTTHRAWFHYTRPCASALEPSRTNLFTDSFQFFFFFSFLFIRFIFHFIYLTKLSQNYCFFYEQQEMERNGKKKKK